MERKHTVKKKRDIELCSVFIVIALITLQLTALSKPAVKIVDHWSIHTQETVNYKVLVQIVVGNIKAHQIYAQNTLTYYKTLEKTKCVKKMKIFSVNCQSWKTAKGNFYSIVDDYDIDVLCLTETFESVKEPVKFKQWCKVSRPRKDGYGGVAILYRDDENGVIIQRKQALERDDVEVICVEVTTQRKESFLLVAAYVPPEKRSS